MALPQFTATKATKSATFQVNDLVWEGDPALLRLDPNYRIDDPYGTDYQWVRDEGSWPTKVRKAIKTYDVAAVDQAVTDLGAALTGKTEYERLVMVAVKCFDNANGTTSTIDWGD